MIRPFNPLTYFKYLFSTSEARTAAIFTLLAGDETCAALLRDLKAYGYEIHYPLLGGGGRYEAITIRFSGIDFDTEFLVRHARGDFKAHFYLPPRFGLGQGAFYFLHELMHFAQDLRGDLQARSVVENEQEAAVQSIIIAHRLGGAVWEGARSSFDWGALARSYAQDHDAEKLAQAWHAGNQKRAYAKKKTGATTGHSPVHLWYKSKTLTPPQTGA